MLEKLGLTGVLGLLVLLAGVVLIARENLLIAAGMAFILAGLGLVVRALISSVMQQFGLF